jgi:lysophospholipase L1-like esterase
VRDFTLKISENQTQKSNREKPVKILVLISAIALALGILLEISLRLMFGFGTPLTYRSDPEIGYLLAPEQKVRRLGKKIEINQYSLRGPTISSDRPVNTWRILLLGDSIANGGWWTDQEETIAALLEKAFPSRKIEVLNASANSWGPRNQLAYLKKYGSFQAQALLLLLNTDDLFSAAPNPNIVGRDKNYPPQRPPLALVELWQKYFTKDYPAPPPEPGDIVATNLNAIAAIYQYSQEQQIPLIIALTPLLREVENQQRPYEAKARQRLEEFVRQHNIPYLDFLPIFQAHSSPPTLYRDSIHLTPTGNEIVTQGLQEALKNSATPSQKSP